MFAFYINMMDISNLKNAILIIAEKPSVARAIALGLSTKYQLIKQQLTSAYVVENNGMTYIVTGVRGHLLQIDFDQKEGERINDIDVMCKGKIKSILCKDSDILIKDIKALKQHSNLIILALDDDREGERICFELMELLGQFQYSRIRLFSLTPSEICYQILHQTQPDAKLNSAAEARAELDLKIGYSFSRTFNRIGKQLNIEKLSYGPCQTSTLNLIVQENRLLAQQSDISFTFNKLPFYTRLYKSELPQLGGKVRIEATCSIKSNDTVVAPTPINTVILLKIASVCLQLSPEETMKCAENLYLAGLITYPRTESTIYLPEKHQYYTEVADSLSNQMHIKVSIIFSSALGKNCGDHLPITPTGSQLSKGVQLTQQEQALLDIIHQYFILSVCGDSHVDNYVYSFRAKQFAFENSMFANFQNNWIQMLTSKKFEIIQPYFADLLYQQLQFTPSVIEDQVEFFKQKSSYQIEVPLTAIDIQSPFILEVQILEKMAFHQIGTDATMATHLQGLLDKNLIAVVISGNKRYYNPTSEAQRYIRALEQTNPALISPTVRQQMENNLEMVATGQLSKQQLVDTTLDIFRKMHKEMKLDEFKKSLASQQQ